MNNNNYSLIRVLVCATLLAWSGIASSQIQFEDVSEETGMTGHVETWGAAWGDMNSDNWPDLFNQGHRDYPRMFRNTGEGTFQDVAYEKDPGNWIDDPFDDKHGASWADYDNDGDDDLLISVSSTGSAMFLVNDNGVFTDRAREADLYRDEAARLGVWFDYNNDGHLDVLQVHTQNGILRRRDPDDSGSPDVDFDKETNADSSCSGKLNYAQLIDLDGNGSLEIICMQEGVFPVDAYDYSTFPFTDVTSSLPNLSHVNDTAVADLNGDLLSDMVLTRGAIRPSGASLVGDNHIEAWLRKDDDAPPGKGFTFETSGQITVAIDHKGMGIYESSKEYVMDPQGLTYVEVAGGGSDVSMSIEYIDAEDHWQVSVIDVDKSFQAYLQIDAVDPITNLIEVDLDTPEFATNTVHLENGPGGLTPIYTSGLYVPVFCVSAVAGDFDNDMDQDVYLVCRRGPDNLSNRMYENQGDGSFVEIIGHGAEGPVGAGFSVGVGESVVTADYDVDGFLDLYVTNGLLYYPVGVGGPENLLHNLGNDNHWLEIDLLGTIANRDGVGAKVYVTAGGVTQLREQNGGYHRWSQNDQRLHIGLASNTTADVRIEWPSGTVDNFTAVAADSLYIAMEGSSITPAVMGPPVYTQLEAGDECGEPPYDLDYGPAVLLWKDCGTDLWTWRVKGGRFSDHLLYANGQITADTPFSSITVRNISTNDTLDNIPANILEFSFGAWYSNDKGFGFSTDGQASACFDFDGGDIPALIVGGSKKRMTGPFDLITLQTCVPPPPPPPAPAECGNPLVSGASDNGLFGWRDCDYAGPGASWFFIVPGGGTPWGSYSGAVESDALLGFAAWFLEGSDTLETTPDGTVIDFVLNVGGTGTDGFQVFFDDAANTCLIPGELSSGGPTYVGEDRTPIDGGFNLMTLEACDPLPPPPVDPACGAPAYDASSEPGVYVWRDCGVPGADTQWSVRIVAGGLGWSLFQGSLTSQSATLAATGYSLEPNDTLDSVPGDGVIDFELFAGGTGQDGFDITVPDGADACFDTSVLPAGVEVKVGAGQEVKAGAFDLLTLGACTP